MHSTEIIEVMGVSEMSAYQLRTKLAPYKVFDIAFIRGVISNGIYDNTEKLFAYCIGAKKHFPKGWTPNKIVCRITPRQTVMDLPEGKQISVTSRYIGVSYKTEIKRWRAQIQKNKKIYNLGSFKTEKQAAVAYNKKAKELGRSLNII